MNIFIRCCFVTYCTFACCFDSMNAFCCTLLEKETINFIALQRKTSGNNADWNSVEVPKSISVRQVIQSIPDGWNAAYEARAHVLSAITFYDGPPENRVSLVYADESRSKNSLTLTWRFSPSTDDGIWIEGKYAATAATLTKQMPIHISSCKVTYDPGIRIDGFLEIKSIYCK
jgi:hypothetical protein